MQDTILIAWVGVGITAVIQGAGIAFFLGRLSTKADGLRRDIDRHLSDALPQAHGCPYYDAIPRHTAGGSDP